MNDIGTVLDGKVTGITKFGAFVALSDNRTGMVHISEIAHNYVSDIREHLTEGQEVKVKIIGVDGEGRINLSIKKTVEQPASARRQDRAPSFAASRKPVAPASLSFEDKLKQFMVDSESKMSGLKQYSDKRGSRRGGRK